VISLPPQQLSFVISGLTPNRKYSLGIKVHYVSGMQSAQTYASASTTADVQAPTSPKGLSVSTPTMNSFSVSWSAASDHVAVVAYEIYLNGTKVAETQQLSYAANGLWPATAASICDKRWSPITHFILGTCQ
jgi:hypothetical protein